MSWKLIRSNNEFYVPEFEEGHVTIKDHDQWQRWILSIYIRIKDLKKATKRQQSFLVIYAFMFLLAL